VLLKEINKIGMKLNTVNALLAIGDFKRINDAVIQAKDVLLQTFTEEKHYQIGVAKYEKQGHEMPDHRHAGIQEYVIQIKGRSAVYFEDGGYRIVEVGQCVAISPDVQHKFVALTDQCEQIYICVPADEGYRIQK